VATCFRVVYFSDDIMEDDAACQICFDDSYDVCGVIDSCSHRFCYPCISKWSGVANTCPLCRSRFQTITQRLRVKTSSQKEGEQGGPNPLGRVLGVEDVEQRDQRAQFEDPNFQQWIDSLVCMVCGGEDNEECLIICDECQSVACHTYCANLDSVPEGEWLCQSCSHRQNRSESGHAVASRTRPSRRVNVADQAQRDQVRRPRTRLRRLNHRNRETRDGALEDEGSIPLPPELEDEVEGSTGKESETSWDNDGGDNSRNNDNSGSEVDYIEDSPVRRRPRRNVSQRRTIRMVRNPGQWQQVSRDQERVNHINRNWEALRSNLVTFEQVLPPITRTTSGRRQARQARVQPSSRRNRRTQNSNQTRMSVISNAETVVDLTNSITPGQRASTVGGAPRRHSSPQPLRTLAAKLRVDLEVETRDGGGPSSTTPLSHHRQPLPSVNVNGNFTTVVPPTADRLPTPNSQNGMGSARRLRTKADYNFASTTVARLSMAPNQQEVSPQPLAQRLAQRGGEYSNAINQLHQGQDVRNGGPTNGDVHISSPIALLPSQTCTRKGKEVANLSEATTSYAEKERALNLVNPHLRLLLEEGVMTREQYKYVARAATHAIMEHPLFTTSKSLGIKIDRNENGCNNQLSCVQGKLSQSTIELEQAAAEIVDSMFLDSIRNTRARSN
jgi:hypothetical protein